MDQIATGKYISLKRRKLNLSKEDFANKLNVKEYTVDDWESGKYMPDYDLVEKICQILNISAAELIGARDDNTDKFNREQFLELIKINQKSEKQKDTILGIMMISLSVTLILLSNEIKGSNILNFISGTFIGLSIGLNCIGIVLIAKNTFFKV